MIEFQQPARPSAARRIRRGLVVAAVVPALFGGWFGWRVFDGRPQGSPQAVELADATLGSELTGATVLAVGEATHGTSEFRQVWRQVAAKVADQGFTTIALEESAGAVSAVDAWVQGGPGTAEDAVRKFGFRLNHTREMVDFVTWARDYNKGRPDAQRVRLYGIDVQRSAADRAVILEHLKKADPSAHQRFAAQLSNVKEQLQTDKELSQQFSQPTADLVDHLEKSATAEGSDAALRARLSARTLHQATQRGIEGIADYDRDKAMFENLEWLVGRRAEVGGKHTLLLAHNGHVDRSGQSNAAPGSKLGVLCAKHWGQGYRVIGTDAHRVRLGDGGEVRSFTVRSPLRGLFAGTKVGYLEFSKVTGDDRELLREHMPMATAGAGFAAWMAWLPMTHEIKVVPDETWDALVLVDDSHPVTPL